MIGREVGSLFKGYVFRGLVSYYSPYGFEGKGMLKRVGMWVVLIYLRLKSLTALGE